MGEFCKKKFEWFFEGHTRDEGGSNKEKNFDLSPSRGSWEKVEEKIFCTFLHSVRVVK